MPAFDFFENIECRYTLGLKNSSRDYSHQNQPLDFESMGNEEREMWTQVKSISFSVSFSKLKSDYAMQNISTCLSAHIQFHARDYMFQSKNMLMGHIPMIPI